MFSRKIMYLLIYLLCCLYLYIYIDNLLIINNEIININDKSYLIKLDDSRYFILSVAIGFLLFFMFFFFKWNFLFTFFFFILIAKLLYYFLKLIWYGELSIEFLDISIISVINDKTIYSVLTNLCDITIKEQTDFAIKSNMLNPDFFYNLIINDKSIRKEIITVDDLKLFYIEYLKSNITLFFEIDEFNKKDILYNSFDYNWIKLCCNFIINNPFIFFICSGLGITLLGFILNTFFSKNEEISDFSDNINGFIRNFTRFLVNNEELLDKLIEHVKETNNLCILITIMIEMAKIMGEEENQDMYTNYTTFNKQMSINKIINVLLNTELNINNEDLTKNVLKGENVILNAINDNNLGNMFNIKENLIADVPNVGNPEVIVNNFEVTVDVDSDDD